MASKTTIPVTVFSHRAKLHCWSFVVKTSAIPPPNCLDYLGWINTKRTVLFVSHCPRLTKASKTTATLTDVFVKELNYISKDTKPKYSLFLLYWLGHLGWINTNRNEPICVMWPKWPKQVECAETQHKIANVFFWLKQVLDRGPEHRESKMTVLCPLIIIILSS